MIGAVTRQVYLLARSTTSTQEASREMDQNRNSTMTTNVGIPKSHGLDAGEMESTFLCVKRDVIVVS